MTILTRSGVSTKYNLIILSRRTKNNIPLHAIPTDDADESTTTKKMTQLSFHWLG